MGAAAELLQPPSAGDVLTLIRTGAYEVDLRADGRLVIGGLIDDTDRAVLHEHRRMVGVYARVRARLEALDRAAEAAGYPHRVDDRFLWDRYEAPIALRCLWFLACAALLPPMADAWRLHESIVDDRLDDVAGRLRTLYETHAYTVPAPDQMGEALPVFHTAT